jgi:Leucine-rich repeat (LRR) protein
LQISSSEIKAIHPESFLGLENHLKHLSLSQNELNAVPTGSLNKLSKLTLLDLSYNKITRVLPNSFEKLIKLATLKLNDNNIELDPGSLTGLETSLRNLNLKGDFYYL